MPNHVCPVCHAEFYSKRYGAKYCSIACFRKSMPQNRGYVSSREQLKKGVVVGVCENRTTRKERMTRIDWLAAMELWRKECLDRGDTAGLRQLADEYAAGDKARHIRPLPRMAAQVRAEAGA